MNRSDRTKLRLLTSRLFTLQLRDQEFRDKFAAETGWTSQSPIIPCEADTPFGEIYAMATSLVCPSEGRVVMIPVLFYEGSGETGFVPRICVLSMSRGQSLSESAIDIESISHAVTMAQVCETLAPKKKWDMAELGGTMDAHRLSALCAA